MKYNVGLLVTLLAIGGISALPAGNPDEDAEVISVPRRRPSYDADSQEGRGADMQPDFKDFKGVIDTGSGYPFLQPNPNPFALNLGFFDSFEDIFRRLRTRLWSVDLPDSTEGSDEGGVLPFDPKKANTTSTVKVVDGHKIEVNDTVYGNDNNLFRVRVINIHPVDSDEEVESGERTITSSPALGGSGVRNAEASDESNESREPLAKKPNENEIGNGNIDDPEVKY